MPGVQQTLEEMDFERGERGEAAAWPAAGNPSPGTWTEGGLEPCLELPGLVQEALRPPRLECGRVN